MNPHRRLVQWTQNCLLILAMCLAVNWRPASEKASETALSESNSLQSIQKDSHLHRSLIEFEDELLVKDHDESDGQYRSRHSSPGNNNDALLEKNSMIPEDATTTEVADDTTTVASIPTTTGTTAPSASVPAEPPVVDKWQQYGVFSVPLPDLDDATVSESPTESMQPSSESPTATSSPNLKRRSTTTTSTNDNEEEKVVLEGSVSRHIASTTTTTTTSSAELDSATNIEVVEDDNKKDKEEEEVEEDETSRRFRITLVDMGEIPISNPRYAGLMQRAAARWEHVIHGGLERRERPEGAFYTNNPEFDWFAGRFARPYREPVDDVVVGYAFDVIDGIGGILGSSKPLYNRGGRRKNNTTPYSTISGALLLDRDDLADHTDADLETIMVHELGHILGIGSVSKARCAPDCRPGGIVSNDGGGSNIGSSLAVNAGYDPARCPHAGAAAVAMGLIDHASLLTMETRGWKGQACSHLADLAPSEAVWSDVMSAKFDKGKRQLVTRMDLAALRDLGGYRGIQWQRAHQPPAATAEDDAASSGGGGTRRQRRTEQDNDTDDDDDLATTRSFRLHHHPLSDDDRPIEEEDKAEDLIYIESFID